MSEYIYGENLGPRVTAVFPRNDYRLEITFNNGEKRIFNANKLLEMNVFAPLKNPEFFKSVTVQCGTIAWPQDIDYCPDTLYAESLPI